MALTEQKINHKIELVGDPRYRTIQVREDNRILRDGVLISNGNFHRYTLVPGSLVDSTDASAIDGTIYTITDVSSLDQEIQNIVGVCWTDAVHTAYEAFLRA